MPVIRIDAEQAKKSRQPGRNRSSGSACLKFLGQIVRLPNSEFRSTLKSKIKDLNPKKYACR